MLYLGQEKREYPRLAHAFLVYYSSVLGSEGFDLTQAKNISAGGLLITTSRLLEKGSGLSLKIRLPGNSYINPTAKVIDSYPSRLGASFYDSRLQFSSINEEDRNAISQVIESHSK